MKLEKTFYTYAHSDNSLPEQHYRKVDSVVNTIDTTITSNEPKY